MSPETHQEFINKRNEDRAAITELTLQNNDDLENEMSDMEDLKDENGNKLDKNTKLRSFERKNTSYPFNNTKNKIMRDSEIYKLIKFNPKTTHPSKYFDYTVIILILLSSLLLIADNPLNDPDSTYSKVLEIIDFVFTFLFLIEAMIKIIALGFFYSSIPANAYIMSGWNILDFIVVTASMVDFIVLIQNSNSVDTSQLQSLKALRALRALRPLRMISRNEGMRLVVNALFASIPSMTNVLIVCLLFIMIFASTGISFFAGKFRYCEVADSEMFKLSDLIDMGRIDDKFD